MHRIVVSFVNQLSLIGLFLIQAVIYFAFALLGGWALFLFPSMDSTLRTVLFVIWMVVLALIPLVVTRIRSRGK